MIVNDSHRQACCLGDVQLAERPKSIGDVACKCTVLGCNLVIGVSLDVALCNNSVQRLTE